MTGRASGMKLTLKMLAPYFAVAVFWYAWPNAWLAILAYHVQILLWRRPSLRGMRRHFRHRDLLPAFPAVLAGPAACMLFPMTRTELSPWLETYGLSGMPLVLMIPYFGLVHPVLEQFHWHQLREDTAWSHILFSGYHVMLLSTLLTIPLLILCFAILAGSSLAWKRMARATRGVTVPAISHILADLGIVVAAWARTR